MILIEIFARVFVSVITLYVYSVSVNPTKNAGTIIGIIMLLWAFSPLFEFIKEMSKEKKKK